MTETKENSPAGPLTVRLSKWLAEEVDKAVYKYPFGARPSKGEVLEKVWRESMALPTSEGIDTQNNPGKSTKTFKSGIEPTANPVLHFPKAELAAQDIDALIKAGREGEAEAVINILHSLARREGAGDKRNDHPSAVPSGPKPTAGHPRTGADPDGSRAIAKDQQLTESAIRDAAEPKKGRTGKKRDDKGETA